MQLESTELMRAALAAQPDAMLALIDPETKANYVVLSREEYDRLRLAASDEKLQHAWTELSTRTRRAWVRENPY